MSPEERKAVNAAVFRNKFRLPVGALQSLLTATGVNFSKAPPVTEFNLPEVATKIRDYANRNSHDSPDVKSNPVVSTIKPNKPAEKYTILSQFSMKISTPKTQTVRSVTELLSGIGQPTSRSPTLRRRQVASASHVKTVLWSWQHWRNGGDDGQLTD